MSEEWLINRWPECEFHLFLAHVREDKDPLVIPLVKKLQAQRILVWGDWLPRPEEPEDWLRFLREKLLRSRHIVYLLTPNALQQSRGWMAAERAYGSHLQSLLTKDSVALVETEMALLTVAKTDPRLDETLWHSMMPTRRAVSVSRHSGDALIDACCEEIRKFICRTQFDGPQRLEFIQGDGEWSYRMNMTPELEDRISGVAPSILPIAPIP